MQQRSLRIALVSDWYSPRIGGLELQMRDLARELTAAGHVVEVITATAGEPFVDGIRVHRLDLAPLLPKWKIAWRRRMVSEVEQCLRFGQYDVVHAHSAFSPVALAACAVARRLDVPSVLTEHSVLKGFGGVLLDGANRLCHWSRWPDVISAVSTYLAGELAEVAGREVDVLPNGVTPADWAHPAQPGAQSAAEQSNRAQSDVELVTVVSVMRLFKRKRPIDIVRAIPKVFAQLPAGARPRFVLVGDGPERPRCEREADRLGVRAHIAFAGWQPREAVKQILSRASIFVLPTSKEALSIATLEALSAGLPVVAMSHGGVGDIVHHGQEGFLADSHDAFCAHIAELAGDGALRRRMAAATTDAVARFAWPNVIERHLALYALATKRRHGGSGVTIPSAAA